MIDFFLSQYKNASTLQITLEFFAFVFGIISVFCAKKENIWVFPSGRARGFRAQALAFEASHIRYRVSYFGSEYLLSEKGFPPQGFGATYSLAACVADGAD